MAEGRTGRRGKQGQSLLPASGTPRASGEGAPRCGAHSDQESPYFVASASWITGLTHLAGAILALAACGALRALALGTGSSRHVVAFAVFGLSLLGLYTASALYHALPLGPIGVARLRRLDHMAIFVLIAGTYTPFCLVAFHDAWRWGLLAAIWSLAAIGVALKIGWMHARAWPAFSLYLGMGWLSVLAIPAFLAAVPLAGLAWVVAGGLVYTLGSVVFATGHPRLYPGVFGAHALWHLFVLAGSACHVWAVARHLTPLA